MLLPFETLGPWKLTALPIFMLRTLNARETEFLPLVGNALKEQQPWDIIKTLFTKEKSSGYFYLCQALTFMPGYIKWILILQLATQLLTQCYAEKEVKSQNFERGRDASSPVNTPKTSHCERARLPPQTISFSHPPIFSCWLETFQKNRWVNNKLAENVSSYLFCQHV